jgi:hypothetical protein
MADFDKFSEHQKISISRQQINFFSHYDFLQSYQISQVLLYTSFAPLIDLCCLKKRAGSRCFGIGTGPISAALFLLRRG